MVLENVKKGDILAVWKYGQLYKEPVEHVTPTQVIAGGHRFNRRTGREVSSTGRGVVTPWRETHDITLKEQADAATARKLASRLYDVRWSDLPLADLIEVHTLMVKLKNREAINESGEP